MSLQIILDKIDSLSFTLTSVHWDDSYDLEVRHSKECIFAFHIDDNRNISIYFGLNLSKYAIDLNLLTEIIKQAESILYKEFDEWKNSPDRRMNE